MLDEELKRIWSSSTQQERVKLDKALLLHDVDNQLHKMERGLKRRNMLEIGAAAFLIPAFLLVAFTIPFLLSKIGAIVIVLACVLIIYMLKKVRKCKPEQTAIPLYDYLMQQREYIYKEMQLLNNVAYWYIGPLFIGFILFNSGFIGITARELLSQILGGLIIGAGIYFYNKQAVKKTLKPLLEKLDNTIVGLQA